MNNKIKIEIKNIVGKVLFEHEQENNTIKKTLEEAVERKIHFEGANLEGANLEEANLKGAYLKGAYLEGANLEGAYLEGAYLEGAYLEGANLEGANLEGAYLEGANLEGANLEGANLKGAYLEGANLEGAYLEGASLCYWDGMMPNVNKIINTFEKETGIKIKKYYINKHILSPYWLIYWKNSLIIDEYEVVKTKKVAKKMTVKQICDALGYEVEIVKEEEDE